MQQRARNVKDTNTFAPPPVQGRQAVPRRKTAPKDIVYTSPVDTDENEVHVTVTHKRNHMPPFVKLILVLVLIGWLIIALANAYLFPFLAGIRDHWQTGEARVTYQQVQIHGSMRDVLTMGYKGRIVIIILASKTAQAQEYISNQFYSDMKSRVLTLEVKDVNRDGISDLVISTGNTSDVWAVLYGNANGGFTWTPPQG